MSNIFPTTSVGNDLQAFRSRNPSSTLLPHDLVLFVTPWQIAFLLRMKLLSVFRLSYHYAANPFLCHEVAITWRSTSLLVSPVWPIENAGHYAARTKVSNLCGESRRAIDSKDSDTGGIGGDPSTVLDSLLKAPDETAQRSARRGNIFFRDS